LSEEEVRKFVEDVKISFMMNSPFFYFMLNSLKIVYVDEVGEVRDDNGELIANTPVGVMGMTLYVYKNALGDGLFKKYPIPTLKHEILHIALEHSIRGVEIIGRMASKHNLVLTEENLKKVHFMVNIAMDAKVNYLLNLDGVNTSWGVKGDKMWSMKDIEVCSVEELVDKLFESGKQPDGDGSGGFDILVFSNKEGKTIQEGDRSFDNLRGKELSDRLKHKVVESVVKAKLAGVGKGDMLRVLEDEFLNPKQAVWWLRMRQLVRSQLIRSKVSDWRCVNRKLPNQIAGSRLIKKPKCACCVDVSGSISDDDYRLFVSEMLLYSKDADVTAIFWDDGIQEIRKIRDKGDMRRGVAGRGGTVFAPVIRGISLRDYDIMICLTDSYWSDIKAASKELLRIRSTSKILVTTGHPIDGFDEMISIKT
jgi:predicted metal-dependent peptidase